MKKIFLISFIFLASIAISYAQLKLLSDGKVGIGTTTPSYKFTLSGTNGIFGVDNTASFLAKNSSGSYEYYLWPRHSDNIMYMNYGANGFNIRNNSSTSTLFMTNDGKVGIGATNPAYKLTISGTTSVFGVDNTAFFVAKNTGGTYEQYLIPRWNDNVMYLNYGTNGFNIRNNGSTSTMFMENDGDVCIGTTASSNQGKLYIYNTNGNAGLRVQKSYTGGAYNIVSQVSDTSCKSIVSQQTILGVAYDKFCVWGNGKTQIGAVFSPTPHVLTVWGTTYSYQGYYSSDIQYKQNITPVTTAIDKLNNLNGVRYSYNNTVFPQMNFPSGFTYGIIAQEVQAVLPELVMADSAGYLAVNYDGLIPILIEAVKSQQLTIKTQEERINTIETDLANCCNIKPLEKMLNQNQGDKNAINNNGVATLYQNIPNPFKIKTSIRYYLPRESNVASMLIFDMQGKLIKTYNINTTGDGNIEINAGELQPGMYMYSLIANGKEVDTKKMILTE